MKGLTYDGTPVKTLTAKNMISAIKQYCEGDETEFMELYKAFSNMAYMGVISKSEYDKFANTVDGWVITKDGICDGNKDYTEVK